MRRPAQNRTPARRRFIPTLERLEEKGLLKFAPCQIIGLWLRFLLKLRFRYTTGNGVQMENISRSSAITLHRRCAQP